MVDVVFLWLTWAVTTRLDTNESASFETALAVIRHQDVNTGSWRAKYTTKLLGPGNSGVGVAKVPQNQTYSETRAGSKYALSMDVSGSARTMHDYRYNGKVYQVFNPLSKSGLLDGGGVRPTGYTTFIYRLETDLSAALASHAADVNSTWKMLDGNRVLAVEWSEHKGTIKRVFWLDPTQRWQPRKSTLEIKYSKGMYPDGRERGLTVIETSEFKKSGEFVMPSRVKLTADEFYPDGKVVRELETQFELNSLETEIPLTDADFSLDFPNGTRVKDKLRGVYYVVGDKNSERPIASDTQPREMTPVQPAPAPAVSWWADWRMWTGVGVLSLVGLVWIKWREKAAG